MSEKRSLRQDMIETAEEVRSWPSYLRTSSSVARVERDARRLGLDPRSVGAPALNEQLDPVTPEAEPPPDVMLSDANK